MPPEFDSTKGIERLLTDIALAISQSAEKYRVGDLLHSTVSINPGTPVKDGGIGYGTWVAFGTGRVLVGIDATQTEFDTVEETGGAKDVTLTAAQSGLPAHNHAIKGQYPFVSGASEWVVQPCNTASPASSPTTAILNNTAANAASSHTNLQPYQVVYIWKRTA